MVVGKAFQSPTQGTYLSVRFAVLLAVEPFGTNLVLCHIPIEFILSTTTRNASAFGLVDATSSGTGSFLVFDKRKLHLHQVLDLIAPQLAKGEDTFQSGSVCVRFLRQFGNAAEMRNLISQSSFIRIGLSIVEQDHLYMRWQKRQKRDSSGMGDELKEWIADMPAANKENEVYLSFADRYGIDL